MLNSSWLNSATLISQKDGSILIGYGPFYRHSTFTLDAKKPSFYLPNFFLSSSQPWLQYNNYLKISFDDLKKLLKKNEQEKVSWKIKLEDKKVFFDTFENLQGLFKKNLLQKAVPYIFTYSSTLMTNERLSNSLYHIIESLSNYPGYLYGHWFNGKGFLGVTPEILFESSTVQPKILKTVALAGTKNSQTKQEFLNNEKELREHSFVIEGLKASLLPLGRVAVGETGILDLSTISHLLTPIQVELNDDFDFELTVDSIHPTPALGAFPRIEGMKWLKDYQIKIDRKYYGAPFGVYDAKDFALCLVGIRQVQWNEEGMRIGAGCGVIKESQLENEWKEIELKIASIRKLIAL